MSDLNPERSRMSLDDLLKANKEQFDKVFANQMDKSGLLAVDHRPATTADLQSASLASGEDPGDVTARLNARYGGAWSSEIMEHSIERGNVTVLCKLVVDGVSKMQFGSARLNGDPGRALQQASDYALAKCAAMRTSLGVGWGFARSAAAAGRAYRHAGGGGARNRRHQFAGPRT